MGETADFQWAVQNGDMDQIRSIVEKDPAAVERSFSGGNLPLVAAADYGHTEVLSYLLEKGADVNKQSKHGLTALLCAIYEGHKPCVKLLLAKGAKKTGKAPDGSSYIDCAEDAEIKAMLQ